MVRTHDVHKYYGELHVLKGVDLSVKKGELIAIVGKSGAGKSTLLHLLGTLDKATSGTIAIGNQDVRSLVKDKLARFRNEKIGFIFQFHHLLDEFTAIENVCIPALIHQADRKQTEAKALDLLTYLGLQDRLDHKPSQLSGGEQQRVAIARALINSPDIILADEPTGNLDTESSKDIHNLIRKLAHELGQTFIIVTHNMELAELCDRVLTMKDGRIMI
ncbi:MAG: ABC transporter ATP-binding protein [Saprospiraceae bacterium]|nr:ABC transporter ATP-binding protein [Saprospiraceae bacterium]